MRGRGILRSLRCLRGSLGSWLLPKVHRGFIAAHYGSGGVGLPSEQLLLLSRVARWFPLGPPFSPVDSAPFACGLLDKVAWVRGGLITFYTNHSRISARSYTSLLLILGTKAQPDTEGSNVGAGTE